MGDGVKVNPQRLAELAQHLSDYAEQVVEHGRALTVLGCPDLGGTEPSCELVDGPTTNSSSTASWVMTDPESRVPAPDPYPPHYPSTAPDPR